LLDQQGQSALQDEARPAIALRLVDGIYPQAWGLAQKLLHFYIE
jgi:hypothetical protein